MNRKITFENYKAFRDAQEMEIRPITVLLGKNSSGKSSVCKLIEMFSYNLDPTMSLFRMGLDPFATNGPSLFHAGDFTKLILGVIDTEGNQLKGEYYSSNGINYIKSLVYTTNSQESLLYSVVPSANIASNIRWTNRIEEIGLRKGEFYFSANHIGPLRNGLKKAFEQSADRRMSLGEEGFGAYSMLVDSYVNGTPMMEQVSHWLLENLDEQDLNISPIQTSSGTLYDFLVGKNNIPINDVGEGFRQVLPIIVESYNPNPVNITIIEQPVLHLHSAAHAAVANRLAMSAIEDDRTYVIETHSENFFLELRRMVSDRSCRLQAEDVIAYYVDMTDGVSTLIPIELDENGEVSFWPGDIWEESSMLLSKIAENKQ